MRSFKEDWFILFVLLVGLLLGSTGILMLLEPRKPDDRLMGLTIAFFFGLVALVALQTLLERRRNRSYSGARQVTLPPGTVLRMRNGRMLLLGAAVGLVGALGFLSARAEAEQTMVFLSLLALGAGLILILLVVTGLAGSNYMAFEAEGLRLGDRGGSVLAAWDNFERILVTEQHNNAAVCLWFKDLAALAATSTGKSRNWAPEKVLKQVSRCRSWFGMDWQIYTWHYGVDAGLLGRAILTYVKDPELREELERSLGLPPG